MRSSTLDVEIELEKKASSSALRYLLENGSWTGTVGTVQRAEADFSMMLSVTWERAYSVAFTRAYFVEPMTFVMKKPGPLPQWQAIIRPFPRKFSKQSKPAITKDFTLELMICSKRVTTTLCGAWYCSRWSSRDLSSGSSCGLPRASNGGEVQDVWKSSSKMSRRAVGSAVVLYGLRSHHDGVDADLSQCHLLHYYVLLVSWILFRTSSSRVFVGMWWLFCILTTTAYKGILISHLTIPSTSPTLDTLEQLADSSFEWGMLDTYGSGYQLFRASTVPIYKRLFEDMQYANMKVSMEKVLDSGYAFISWKTYFRNLIAKDFTDSNGYTAVHIAREDFFPAGFGWAFPKGSLYLTKFDQLVQRLIESGLIEKWMSDLIRNSALQSRMALRAKKESAKEQEGSPPAATADPENPVPLAFTIYHLQGAFFAIFIGFSLSVLAFLAELCFGNSRKDERPKTTDEGEQESEVRGSDEAEPQFEHPLPSNIGEPPVEVTLPESGLEDQEVLLGFSRERVVGILSQPGRQYLQSLEMQQTITVASKLEVGIEKSWTQEIECQPLKAAPPGSERVEDGF
ncbi:uncharacterized protein LOC143032583 [Oratosquilla oratoria]|uniref:uncharacterized protein LOC143032583 n=1 Tax=Oratosquilla oratoria TaxID=337810 RepID=UPI003F7576A3